jgi:hypothetical protein
VLEIVLPPLFALFLVFIKNAVSNAGNIESEIVNATFPDFSVTPFSFTDYITAMRARRICVDVVNSTDSNNLFDISGILDNGGNWQVPFVKCDSRKCDFAGQDALPFCEFAIIAVAGSDTGGQERALAFEEWIYQTYPAIAPSNPNKMLPFNFSLVRLFDSSGDMDKYVKSSDYGRVTVPKIAIGVVWQGNDNVAFNYSLRQNSTNFNAPEDEGRPTAQTTPPTGSWIDSFARDDFSVCLPIDGAPVQGLLGLSCTGQYMYNGVLTIQRLVHDFIFNVSGAEAAGVTVAEAGVQFAPFPTKEYTKDGFYATIGGTLLILEWLNQIKPLI